MEGMRWAHGSKWSELHYKITSDYAEGRHAGPIECIKGSVSLDYFSYEAAKCDVISFFIYFHFYANAITSKY